LPHFPNECPGGINVVCSLGPENATTYLHAGGLLLAFNGDELGFERLLRDPKGHLDRVIILVSKAVSTRTHLDTLRTGRVSLNAKHTTCLGCGFLPASACMVKAFAPPPWPRPPNPVGACRMEPSGNPRSFSAQFISEPSFRELMFEK